MASAGTRERFLHFGPFRLDGRSGELYKEGRRVRLPPQASRLLLMLVSSRGELVSREEIQKALWSEDTFVEFDDGINKCVKQIRGALGNGPTSPGYVQTVSRRGYRFVGEVRGEGLEPVDRERPPYPGLSSFTELDAAYFFGREGEVEALWKKIEGHRLLAVMGPSGAGKSSFLKAGLLPSCPTGYRAVYLTPGNAPLAALARALVPELSTTPEVIQRLVSVDSSETVIEAVSELRKRSGEVLIVIDAFEELFTLNPAATQGEFSRLLGRLASECGAHVLLSMRDDFLFRCHEQEALRPVFTELTPLGTLTGAALRRGLVEPALSCGYRFESEELIEEMLTEVEGERGALPLLAFAASRLWEKRDRVRKVLTREAYEANGRVGGALSQHAEDTLEKIASERASLVRELFRNLMTSQGTRAGREVTELLSVFRTEEERKGAEEVLRQLVASRLLTSYETTGEKDKRERRVEIVHESLLTAWPRLVRWQTQDAEGAVLRDQLRQASRSWEERGRPEGLLWTGTTFRELALFRERYSGGLSAAEQAFAEAATKLAGRRRRRRRIGSASLLTVAVAVAAVTSSLWRRSEAAALRAEAAKVLALAELRLTEDPTEALAFATASLELADTEEARLVAMKALWDSPPAFELNANSEAARAPVFSSDGMWLATSGFAPDVLVWSEEGKEPVVLAGHETSPRGGNHSQWASGDLLVTGSYSTVGTKVFLWSLPEGHRVRTIDFGRPSYWQVGNGQLFAETLALDWSQRNDTGLLRSWALPDGEPTALGNVDWGKVGTDDTIFEPDGRSWLYIKDGVIYSRPLPTGSGPDRLFARLETRVKNYRASSEPDQLAAAEESGESHLWSFPGSGAAEETVIPKRETASDGVLPDSTGRWLSGLPEKDQQLRLWSLAAWAEARPLSLRRSGSWYASMKAFHPTGDWVVAGTGGAYHLTFWPLAKTYPAAVDGYTTVRRPLAFSPDGKWLATAWGNRRLRLWPVPGSGSIEVRSFELPEYRLVTGLAFDPQARYLFAVGIEDRAWVVPLDGSPPRILEGFSADTLLQSAAVSPSGRLVATAFFYGQGETTLRVWNLETGELRRFELPERGETTRNEKTSTGYERGVFNLEFLDESTLYTVGDAGLLRWNLDTGSHEVVPAASAGHAERGAFSKSGIALIRESASAAPAAIDGAGGKDCGALVQNLAAGEAREVLQFGHSGSWGFEAVALDPTGTVAATGSVDGVVRVGRLSGEPTHVLVGHKGSVDFIAISPDLRWVATTGEDNTLRLWPMPDLSKPPLHTLPHDELVAKLHSLTNFRAVRDPSSPNGWKVEVGAFPGWKTIPSW